MGYIKYNAAIYVRISREDGTKKESDSITNQKLLIQEYLKSMTDIEIHSIRADDGFGGADFNRPGFNAMISDIYSGVINCVVVKDLSRFGRDYIECGKLIQIIFPRLGVRFISINDNYDSFVKSSHDEIMIYFQNLVNDSYLRDISVKIRSHLEVKRKRGEYIGPFVTYGYLKSLDEKNKIVIDEYAACVIKQIFRLKMEGLSNQGIANSLNEVGVLSPLEYKKYIGSKFKTSFKINLRSKWSAISVARILKNEIYTGTLEQGKRTTLNHKLKIRIEKPKDKWTRIENAHQPIISQSIFDTVKKLNLKDMRASSIDGSIYLFSGFLRCGYCDQNMVRKTTYGVEGKKYNYYVCSTHKINKKCSPHSIRDKNLEKVVLDVIQHHISTFVNQEKIGQCIENHNSASERLKWIDERIKVLKEEYKKNMEFKMALYKDEEKGIISSSEFDEFMKIYDLRCDETGNSIIKLKLELNEIFENRSEHSILLSEYIQKGNIKELSRKLIAMLIDRIVIHNSNSVEVVMNYTDVYKSDFKISNG